MKEAYRILPVYAGDVSGIASALYELGGMVVIHDPSGCNSTYNTHDEIRWYDQESHIFISGLNMRDAVLGNDQKFISDIVEAAGQIYPKPAFIAICNSPVPYLNGTDFHGICRIVEKRCGIRTFYVPSNGMHDYVRGAGRAFLEYARAMLPAPCPAAVPVRGPATIPEPGSADDSASYSAADSVSGPAADPVSDPALCGAGSESGRIRVCVLGATPLTYGNRQSVPNLRRILESSGFCVTAVWAMGSTLEEIDRSTDSDVNLVISDTGILAARYLKETYGIPYVTGVPVSRRVWAALKKKLREAVRLRRTDGTELEPVSGSGNEGKSGTLSVYIGEAILSASLAASGDGQGMVLCPFADSRSLLAPGDRFFDGEEELLAQIASVQARNPNIRIELWADPMYRTVLPESLAFHPLPTLALSGRLYRTHFPDYFGWTADEASGSIRHMAKYDGMYGNV